MECTGRMKEVLRDYGGNRLTVSFEVNENLDPETIEEIRNADRLDIRAVKHRERRSLDSNAYFHLLVGKLADRLGLSKPRMKNLMLHRYGQPELLEDGRQAVIKTNIPPESMLEREELHTFPCGCRTENGMELTFYRVYRGSSTLDSREMSVLIGGVVDECREQGIQTETPDEIARMNALWGRKYEKIGGERQ